MAAAEAARQDEQEQAEGFEFAGYQFRDQTHAANEFRRALGRLKAQGRQVSEIRNYATQAVNTALAWQNWAQQQQQQAAAQGRSGPGGPSSGAQDGGSGPAEATPAATDLAQFADGVDWGQVQAVQDEYGPVVAQNYLMRKLARAAAEYTQSQLQQALQPLQEQHEEAQALNSLEGLFEQAAVASEVEGGEALYPELEIDGEGELVRPDVAEIVIMLFKEAVDDGIPPGPRAVHHAVLEFRRLCGERWHEALGVTTNQPQRGPSRGNAGVGAQVRRALASASTAAAGFGASNGGAPLRPRRGPASAADELDADFERARKRVNPIFGVSR
jgi:hypothetical protein